MSQKSSLFPHFFPVTTKPCISATSLITCLVARLWTIRRFFKLVGLFCKRALQIKSFWQERPVNSGSIRIAATLYCIRSTHCYTLQQSHCNALQRTATHCNALQRTATHCNALQCTASHCNTLYFATTKNSIALEAHNLLHSTTLTNVSTLPTSLSTTNNTNKYIKQHDKNEWLIRVTIHSLNPLSSPLWESKTREAKFRAYVEHGK